MIALHVFQFSWLMIMQIHEERLA